jgi:hypothetical protein
MTADALSHEGLQNAVDAMVGELHELLDDCAQGGDETGAVYVWAVRELLGRYRVTTEQLDHTDWAAVARDQQEMDDTTRYSIPARAGGTP